MILKEMGSYVLLYVFMKIEWASQSEKADVSP